jgi:hypothetical protein
MHALLIMAMTIMMSNGRKDAYIISTGDNTTFSTNVDVLQAVRKRIPARSIWVRRGGREYLIVDETLLLRAVALFEPEMALGPEQEAIGREEEKLDREIDALEDAPRLTTAEKRRLSELRARQRVVEQQEKELDEREEALDREAERQLWPLVDTAIRAGLARPTR